MTVTMHPSAPGAMQRAGNLLHRSSGDLRRALQELGEAIDRSGLDVEFKELTTAGLAKWVAQLERLENALSTQRAARVQTSEAENGAKR